jgi:hypothetical protein
VEEIVDVSVVMATWQGQRYLPAQLASIVGQSRPIDELVVVDDASDDETIDILNDLADRAPFKVHIITPSERQGSTAAFALAIERATGDVIALADQDDLWYPHKVARLVETFAEHPDAAYVFTDAHLVDGADRPLPGTLWSTRRLTPRLQDAVRQDPFSQLAQRFLVTGCTMAFRSDLRGLVLPIPDPEPDRPPLVHDRWISVVLAAVGGVVPLDEPLMAYRIHAEQQIGLRRTSATAPVLPRLAQKVLAPRDYTFDVRDEQIRMITTARERVIESGLATEAARQRMDDVIGYLQFRRDQPERRRDRVAPVAREALLGTYGRQARGLKSIAVDLFRK